MVARKMTSLINKHLTITSQAEGFLKTSRSPNSMTTRTLKEASKKKRKIASDAAQKINFFTISYSLTKKRRRNLSHCIHLFVDGANGFTASGEAVNAPLAEKPPKAVDDTVSSAQMPQIYA